MIDPSLYSSRRDDWATPHWLFDALNAEFDFTLDPAATAENAKCAKYFTPESDGLIQSWAGERVFLNPPYGRGVAAWMRKAATEHVQIAVVLVHARTDTRWWHDWVMPFASELRFVKGRVRFEGAPSSSPFPSVLVIYRPGFKGEPIPCRSWTPSQ